MWRGCAVRTSKLQFLRVVNVQRVYLCRNGPHLVRGASRFSGSVSDYSVEKRSQAVLMATAIRVSALILCCFVSMIAGVVSL